MIVILGLITATNTQYDTVWLQDRGTIRNDRAETSNAVEFEDGDNHILTAQLSNLIEQNEKVSCNLVVKDHVYMQL